MIASRQVLLFVLSLIAGVLLTGCQKGDAPPSPTVIPDPKNENWTLVEDMVYSVGSTGETIIVPKGFVTDFASIPRTLWTLFAPHGQYSRAAVIHDYLYWSQGCTRDQADRLMVIAMKESQVGSFDEHAIYAAVHAFGEGAWINNQKERAAGLLKVVPGGYIRPKDPNTQWQDHRKYLASQGLRDPEFEFGPKYCRFGDSMEVPVGVASGLKPADDEKPVLERI